MQDEEGGGGGADGLVSDQSRARSAPRSAHPPSAWGPMLRLWSRPYLTPTDGKSTAEPSNGVWATQGARGPREKRFAEMVILGISMKRGISLGTRAGGYFGARVPYPRGSARLRVCPAVGVKRGVPTHVLWVYSRAVLETCGVLQASWLRTRNQPGSDAVWRATEAAERESPGIELAGTVPKSGPWLRRTSPGEAVPGHSGPVQQEAKNTSGGCMAERHRVQWATCNK